MSKDQSNERQNLIIYHRMRVHKLIQELKTGGIVGNQAEFAKKLNRSPSTVSGWLKKNNPVPIPHKALREIVEIFDLDKEYFVPRENIVELIQGGETLDLKDLDIKEQLDILRGEHDELQNKYNQLLEECLGLYRKLAKLEQEHEQK